MNHFSIIQALCRSALAAPSPAVRKQVERLQAALAKDGDDKQAASIAGLLATAQRAKEVAPSRIERSKTQLVGETLGPSTAVPVDHETSAALAEIIFPSQISPRSPLFNPAVTQAVGSFIDEWANFDALSELGIVPSKTCLIYGAPGTGKTRLALWIAHELGLPVVVVKLDGLVPS